MTASAIRDLPGTWACACVRRHPNGDLRSIRLHLASVVRCDDCGAYRPDLWPTTNHIDPLHAGQEVERPKESQ